MIKITVLTSLYNCSKYLTGYFDAVEKIVNKEECEFLLLHNAPQKKEIDIITKNIQGKYWFRHIEIEQREGLYSTWNRGVKLSNGEYCAIWNVDDIRFPDSLFLQSKALDENKNCGLVTGHINGTDIYGEIGTKFYKHDRMVKHPKEVFRSCLVGCFPMWRKSIHNTIGYFDEQFKCVSDFDFQIRVALHYNLYCIPESLGVYLENDPNKISSNNIQMLENNIIYLRYGIYEKLILTKINSSKRLFKKDLILNNKTELAFVPPIIFSKSCRIKGLFVAIYKLPYYIFKNLLNMFINQT